MPREARIERSQYREGSPQRCGHSTKTQHGPRRQVEMRGQTGCAQPAARCPLAVTGKHTTLHYWLFYASRQGGGCYTYWEGWGREGGPRDLCTRRHWGALTSLWPRRGGLGGTGSGLRRRNGTW